MKRHEIIERALVKLGSAKSGHYGHKGVPGKRGGSAPSIGGGRWEGSTIEERTADFIVNHRPGVDIPPTDIDEYYDRVRLRPGEENYGDWARNTLAQIRSQRLVDEVDFLGHSDLILLQKIEDKNIWRINRQVAVVPPSKMPELDRVAVEREYGISRHAILPADLKPDGTWSFEGGQFRILVSTESQDKRATFWHEFGHTVTGNVIDQFLGPPKEGESSGAYMERFAKRMSGGSS